GSEEYLDSEKYQIRAWDREAPHSLAGLITKLNHARRAHPALQRNEGLRFHDVDNAHLLCYSKSTPDRRDVILVVVNLDPFNRQSGWVHLDLDALGIAGAGSFAVDDLLAGVRFIWQGAVNYVELAPDHAQAHVFQVRSPIPPEGAIDGAE